MSSARRAPSHRKSKITSRRRRPSHRPRRLINAAEQLELRQLMAGDVNPFHNDFYPQDVNNDWMATPLDALLIINELNTSGARQLQIPSGGGSGEDVATQFMDVNGDGYLTPSDALDVINHLNAGGEGPTLVTFRTRLFGENGREITGARRTGSGTVADPFVYTLSKDDRFAVSVQIRDERPDGPANTQGDTFPLGIFATYTDLFFDPSKADLGFSEVQQFTLSNIDLDVDGQSQITITLPGTGTTAPITITEPGATGNDAALDRANNANGIRSALTLLVGGAGLDDIFRVSVSNNTYTIRFLGDFVNRDIDLMQVNVVAGQGPVDVGPVTSTFEPVAVDTDDKANMDRALNFNPLYGPTADPEGAGRFFAIYQELSPTQAVIERAGAIATGDTSTTDGDGTDYQYTVPENVSNPQFREFYRPYFVAANATGTEGTVFRIDPPGHPVDDAELDAFTVTLLIGGQNASGQQDPRPFDPKVRRDQIDYGAPIIVIIKADVTATPDTPANTPSTVMDEGAGETVINVLANDTNNVTVGGPLFVVGVGADGNQGPIATTNGGSVRIDAGQVKYTPGPNRFGTDTFTYFLSDTAGGASKDSATVTIQINELNDPPTADDDVVTIDEDAGPVNVTATLLNGDSADPDPTTGAAGTFDVLTITSVTPSASPKGTVSVNAGVVTYTPFDNVNGTDTFTYTLSDGRGGTDTATVTVNITALNDPPSYNLDPSHTSDEDAGLQTVTEFAEAILPGPPAPGTPESDGPVTFTVTQQSADGTLTFAQAPAISSTGTLTYRAADNAFGTATFQVIARDASNPAGVAAAKTFTITVNAVNDNPTFTALPDITRLEDQAGNVPGFVANISPGPNEGTTGQTVSFAVVVQSTTGTLAFTTPPAIATNGTLTYTLSPNTFGTATIQVTANDTGTPVGSTVDTFILTIDNVNDPPNADDDLLEAPDGETTFLDVLANDDITPDEGSGETLRVISFDVDPTTPLPAGLELSDITITAGGTGLQITTPDFLDSGFIRINYTISDRLTGGETDSAVVTVNFVPAELPRAVADPALGPVLEDTLTFTSLPVLANDRRSDTTDGVLAVTGVRFPGEATFATAGQTRTDANGNQIRIAANGLSVEFLPGANVDDNVQFEYEVTETSPLPNDGPSFTTSTVVITPINDPPSFTIPVNEANALEDSALVTVNNFATNISQGPGETGQTLTFEVTNNTNPSLFAQGPTISADGTLTFRPAANANGVATITVQLRDSGGTSNGGDDVSDTATYTINVTPVNDEPTFVKGADPVIVDEDAGPVTINPWATSIIAGPADERPGGPNAQTVTFAVTGNTNPSLFAVAPSVDPVTGILTFTPAAEAAGSATITLELSDNGGTANSGDDRSTQTFVIQVNAVNDPPSFTKGLDQTVNEDAGAQTVNPWATNISAGPANESTQLVSFEVTNNTNAALFAVQPAVSPAGVLTYTPAANANGSATITLRIRDDNGTPGNTADDAFSATQTFTITVESVNDAPSFTKGPDQTRLEDAAGVQTVTGWATNISAGPADESGQTPLTFNVNNNNNALFSVQPAIASNGTLTYTLAPNANGSATVTVTLSDTGGTDRGGVDTSAPQTFLINVTAVNDEPSFTLIASPNQTVQEDAGAQTVTAFAPTRSAGPADESGQTLTFNVTNNNNALFSVQPSIDPATGNLTYTPAANAFGTATVSVFLRDNGGTANGGDDTSPTQTFTITVNAVNDPPPANPDGAPTPIRVFKSANETAFDVLTNDTPNPDPGETLTVTDVVFESPTSFPPETTPTIRVLNNQVLFKPNGFVGTVVARYTVSDGTLTNTATITFNVVNFVPGNITGTVWADVNDSGGIDGATIDEFGNQIGPERRLAGVEVYLTGSTIFLDPANPQLDDLDPETPGVQRKLTRVTNQFGEYSFNGLVPGNYTVSLDNPDTAGIIEGVELHTDGKDGFTSATGSTPIRTSNNVWNIVFGEEGTNVQGLNFGILGLLPNYVNIRDHLASSTSEGIVFGADLGAATLDGQQFWYALYDGWTGMHSAKMRINMSGTTPVSATIEARDTNNTLHSRTLSFTTDYLKIRIMGRSGNNIVVGVVGDAQDIFPGADQVAAAAPQGEPDMYSEGEGAEYAAAADEAFSGEESWA